MPRAVILTAIPIEYKAVRSHLTNLKEEIHPQGTIYERGSFSANGNTWEVGIVEVGAGNSGAALEAERAIAYFQPNVILFVGVAGGIKDVELGDVVAATKVYGYESGKVEINFKPRPDVGQSTYGMIQRAKAEAKKEDWLARLKLLPSSTPNVFVAPIAAGEKVVASKESSLFGFLQFNYGDAIAVEMEGRGLLQAAHANQQVSALIVRGISDLIEKKSEADASGSQVTAAYHASAFAFEVLAKLNASQQTVSNNKSETPTKTPSFFAYDNAWVGREDLINNLSSRIQESCRLLILVGITGIGKTALGERLAVELEDWFDTNWDNYLKEDFDNEEQSSDFASVAGRLLEKCGEPVTPEDRKDTQRLLNRLVRHLQENRYLIQIDSLEKILEGNEEKGWNDFKDEWWVKFWKSFLGKDSCQSSIILTSQDLPRDIRVLGTHFQNFWSYQLLSGLEEPEQLALFAKTGLDVSNEAKGKPYLQRIGRAYEGHPLALRVIAGEIVDRPFNSNVQAYWNKYGQEVEEVEKAIEEAKSSGVAVGADDNYNLQGYTTLLRDHVKHRLENTYSRLRKDVRNAYLLLCESSVYRCEVTEDFWLSHLEDWDIDEEGQLNALNTLRDRFLVEEMVDESDQVMVRQHNLIRGVSLEHLKKLDDEEDE